MHNDVTKKRGGDDDDIDTDTKEKDEEESTDGEIEEDELSDFLGDKEEN